MRKHITPFLPLMQMLLGTALTAAAFGLIIIPQGFAAGGATGFSRLIAERFSISLSAVVFAVNMGLLLLGLVFVGRRFVAKTVVVSLLFPVLLEVFSGHSLPSVGQNAVPCAVVSGVMLGIGTGLVLRSGASSGGFDILALILNKKCNAPVAAVMNVCDAAVILTQSLKQPLEQTVYGILVITICAAVVGRMAAPDAGGRRAVLFFKRCTAVRSAR